jgi:hypothetical protein
MTTPGFVEAAGSLKVLWVPVIANPSAPDLSTELGAAGAFDATCYFTRDGWQDSTEETAIDNSRLCTIQTYEAPGRLATTLTVTYAADPQNQTPTDNKAFVGWKRGTDGFFVARWGLLFSTELTAGDIVDVYPVTCGSQNKMPIEENSFLKINQKMLITGDVVRDVAIVA